MRTVYESDLARLYRHRLAVVVPPYSRRAGSEIRNVRPAPRDRVASRLTTFPRRVTVIVTRARARSR